MGAGWVSRPSLRHEAEFNKGMDSDLHQAVIDEVNSSEVQQQIARLILTAVDSCLVFKNPMKPDVLYVHDFSQRAQILAPIFTEGHGSMAGPEHMFPEMRERRTGNLRVDNNFLFH